MDLSSGDLEGSNEDLTGKKMSKLKSLKTRLFGKTKSEVNGGQRKLSQSASDISQGQDDELDLEDRFSSNLGSRAVSHESIFLAEQCQSSSEPPGGLSQENAPTRIQALQMKLQQQNLRLGQPPLVMSIRRPEDAGASSEDDGLPQSPPEIILSDVLAQRTSCKQPSSPTVPIISAHPSDLGVNFDAPAQFKPCLDSSAARHRMSVKPRNQRASAKVRKLTSQPDSQSRSESMNSLEHPTLGREDEKVLGVSKEPINLQSNSTQVLWTGERPSAHRDENHLSTSNHESLKESEITHKPSAPMQPPVQPRPVMGEGTAMKSSVQSKTHVAKDQEPPVALGSSSVTKAPFISPVGDPRKNPMAPETAGTKPPASPRLRSGSGTRQVGESLGIYPLKPAPTSVPTAAVPQDIPAAIPANKDARDKQSDARFQMADKRGTQSVNPQTEIRQPVTSVHGTSGSLTSEATQMKTVSNNKILQVKGQGESGMLPQLGKVSVPRQTDKPQVVENVASTQQRPSSALPRFTISSAHRKDQTKTGNLNGTPEETGPEKDLTKPNFPQNPYQTQERCGIQKGDVNAKELPRTIPAEIPCEGNVEPKLLQQKNSRVPNLEESLNLPHEIGEEATEVEGQDAVEEAVEACEDLREPGEEEPAKGEGEKNAFGIKLRSTSLSLKYKLDSSQTEGSIKRRSADVSSLSTAQGSLPIPRAGRSQSLNKPAASPCSDSLVAASTGQSIPSAYSTRDKLRSRSLRQEGEANQSKAAYTPKNVSIPSPGLEGVSAATSSTTPSISSAPPLLKDGGPSQPADLSPTNVKEPEPASSDFSWMNMAMEKTRTIHQLFTSKLPDFPEGPSLSGAPQTIKEFSPSPTTETAPVPSPSVKRKSASSPTKQMLSTHLSSNNTAPVQSSNLNSTATNTAKEQEAASSEASWMSMAMEKTRNLQQLFTSISPEFPGPQAAAKTPHTTETQPPVLTHPALSTESIFSEKTSAQPSRAPKQTAPPDASPAVTSQSSSNVSQSRPGQAMIKPQPVAESSSKPTPITSSKLPVTQTVIRGTSLRESQPVAAQPKIVSTQLAKLAQSQQTMAHSIPPSSPMNKSQASPPLFSVQAIPRPSQAAANSHLSSSPKPSSHQKQQSQPAPLSTSEGGGDGPYSLKKRVDFPLSAPGKGSDANAAPESWGPRATAHGSKAAFMEKWGDKGPSADTKFETSKATSEAQSSPGFYTSVRPGHVMRDSKTDKDLLPRTVPTRTTEDRPLKKTMVSSISAQQPASDGAQPSWMEMAKRKSLAWSDKSMD